MQAGHHPASAHSAETSRLGLTLCVLALGCGAVALVLLYSLLGIGGGLGIVLAGPILQHLSYHWLFCILLVLTSIATAAAILFIAKSPIRAPARVDWLGGVLLSAWLVALLVAV